MNNSRSPFTRRKTAEVFLSEIDKVQAKLYNHRKKNIGNHFRSKKMKTLYERIKIFSMHHYWLSESEILSKSKDNKFKTNKMSIKNLRNYLQNYLLIWKREYSSRHFIKNQ